MQKFHAGTMHACGVLGKWESLSMYCTYVMDKLFSFSSSADAVLTYSNTPLTGRAYTLFPTIIPVEIMLRCVPAGIQALSICHMQAHVDNNACLDGWGSRWRSLRGWQGGVEYVNGIAASTMLVIKGIFLVQCNNWARPVRFAEKTDWKVLFADLLWERNIVSWLISQTDKFKWWLISQADKVITIIRYNLLTQSIVSYGVVF